MHCGNLLSFKATALQAMKAVMALPLSGRRLQHNPCSTEFYSWRCQSSYSKLPSISPRVSHITRATEGDDAIVHEDDALAQPYMPEEWPDFSKMKVAPDVEYKFFHRKEEYEMILGHLNSEPSEIILLFGPQHSGKSALLSSIIKQEGSCMLHLDLGMQNASSPELMARQLHNQARKLPSVLGMKCIESIDSKLGPFSNLYKALRPIAGANDAIKAGSVTKAFMADLFPEESANNLPDVMDSYKLVLENIPPGQKKPVIVIDQANALRMWKSKDMVALRQFLEFLKRSCKQCNKAHVVVATSDYSLVPMLESLGFDENVRREEVIGDLTSAEAFLYVCGGTVLNREGAEEDWPGLIAQSEDTLALGMTPEDWKKVWSVCGGNPHLLKVCVGYAKQYNSWDEGVRQILSKAKFAVNKALRYPELLYPPVGSSVPRIWKGEDYLKVMGLINASPYHAITQTDAVIAVPINYNVPSTCAEVLMSMAEFNLFSLRPYSKMAKDIPKDAFICRWGQQTAYLVTMPSPAHLAAVREMYPVES